MHGAPHIHHGLPLKRTCASILRENHGLRELLLDKNVQFTKEEWDACAHAAAELNPFLLYDFLLALEESESATPATGWMPQHLALRDTSGKLLAAAPVYAKAHSYGEYVFDHSWARLHAQLGATYYPKLQCCIPFTPVTGPRMLVAPALDAGFMTSLLLQGMKKLSSIAEVRVAATL
jgi:uncharacterized protein